MSFVKMVDCLPLEFCEEVINCSESIPFNRSEVLTEGGGVRSSYRTNDSATIPYDLQDQAHGYINAAVLEWSKLIENNMPFDINSLPLPGRTAGLDTFFEMVSLLRYSTDQEYNWHVDCPWVAGTGRPELAAHERLITVVVYLNSDFKGGETEMLDQVYTPEAGKALVFPATWAFPHRARPITEGTKYALVTWYHAKTS